MAIWIANAGERLIDLDITARPSGDRNVLFAELPQYSTRLRSLNLQLGSCGEKSFPNTALHGRFPYLEKLSIENTMTGVCNAFEIAPLLTHVELRKLSYCDVKLPWAQIEHLVLDPPPDNWAGRNQVVGGLDVLWRTPSVMTLVVDNADWIVPALCANPHWKSAKFLPNLDRLVIRGCHLNMDTHNLKKIIGQRWRREVERPARLTSLELTFRGSYSTVGSLRWNELADSFRSYSIRSEHEVNTQQAMIAETAQKITDGLQELVEEGLNLVIHVLH
ncbi:hypothetical protein C8F01DRAFT_1082832 [Mycena amicta]|nr:hypothetical protein C8F01DRAFT_1082832 [Mycena amicta]